MARTFIINTMTEQKYSAISSSISENELNVIDDDNTNRLVIPSFDLINKKTNEVKTTAEAAVNAISEDVSDLSAQVLSNYLANISLVHEDGKIKLFGIDKTSCITYIDDTEFVSDNYLSAAEYSDGKFLLYVVKGDGEMNVVSVDFPVDQTVTGTTAHPVSDSAVKTYVDGVSAEIDSDFKTADGETYASALTDAKAYTDSVSAVLSDDYAAKDEAVLTAAKGYTDEVSALIKNNYEIADAETYTSVLNDAKAYVDSVSAVLSDDYVTRDAETYVSAVAYADSVSAALSTDYVTKDAETLDSAKSYVNEVSALIKSNYETADGATYASALTDANAYGDSVSAALSIDYTSKDGTTLDTAKAYVDEVSAGIQSNYKTADGETYTSALNDAKTYADSVSAALSVDYMTKDSEGLEAAKSYVNEVSALVKTDYQTADGETYASAIAYVNSVSGALSADYAAKDADVLTTTKAYTDEISAGLSAIILSADNALSAELYRKAKTYTDTKVGEYTTAKIGELSNVYRNLNDLSVTFISTYNISGETIEGNMPLSVIKIDALEYNKLVVTSAINDTTIYVVDGDYINAYDQQICALTMSDVEDVLSVPSIAATKHYVDSLFVKKSDITAALAPLSAGTADVNVIASTLSTLFNALQG